MELLCIYGKNFDSFKSQNDIVLSFCGQKPFARLLSSSLGHKYQNEETMQCQLITVISDKGGI